jgi:hypothetical protein
MSCDYCVRGGLTWPAVGVYRFFLGKPETTSLRWTLYLILSTSLKNNYLSACRSNKCWILCCIIYASIPEMVCLVEFSVYSTEEHCISNIILVIQWDRQMEINYTWSVFKPKWFSRSTDPGYGSCCNDNICSLRSGKDTPFTFHAHWIGQRLLVSEVFLEDHTLTRTLSERERVSTVCSIAFPCKIRLANNSLFSEHCSAHWPVHCLATIRKFSQESWLTCCP